MEHESKGDTRHEERIEYQVDTKFKEQMVEADGQEAISETKSLGEQFVEEYQFTWRASIIGSLLGCLVAASNTYLGLKIGWTFGASLFGAIFSFAIIKPLSRVLPVWLGGGPFGPKENVTAQSAATTAGGLSAGFVAGVPAMYKLGLMTTPRADAAALVLFTISAAFYGLFFAVPLRRHFVISQDLPFPTPRATATTIISLHNSVGGEKEAMKKAKWMGFFFVVTFIWTLISYWVPFFDTIHVLWWIGYDAGYANMMSADADWGWYFKFDFPFFGAGLMTPGSTVWSFFIASLFLYGIIGPTLVTNGGFVAPLGFNDAGDTTQSFFLWPGIALMVLSSLTELFVRYETLWRALKGAYTETRAGLKSAVEFIKYRVLRKPVPKEEKNKQTAVAADDIYTPKELVPTYWWILGVTCSIIFTCAIMGEFFGMPVYQSIVAVIIAFILSFVGIQAAGETDINPTGSIGKMTQLIFAGMPAHTHDQVMKNNLMAGTISASAASQAVDMVGDLKTGQLVGASPRSQFLAQLVASVPAVGIAVGLFILFAEAYPCVINEDLNTANCEFQLVAVMAWLKVTQLLTGSAEPLSRACIIVTAVCAVIGVIAPIIRFFLVPDKYRRYFPSVAAIGIAMINPSPEIPLSMAIGWTAGKIWKRINPKAYDDFMYSVAGGMIAGQGISALLQAVFKLGNVEAYTYYGSCIMADRANCP